jgi:hypothetical protein
VFCPCDPRQIAALCGEVAVDQIRRLTVAEIVLVTNLRRRNGCSLSIQQTLGLFKIPPRHDPKLFGPFSVQSEIGLEQADLCKFHVFLRCRTLMHFFLDAWPRKANASFGTWLLELSQIQGAS